MTDITIPGLPAAADGTFDATSLIAVSIAGATKKMTGTQLNAFIVALADIASLPIGAFWQALIAGTATNAEVVAEIGAETAGAADALAATLAPVALSGDAVDVDFTGALDSADFIYTPPGIVSLNKTVVARVGTGIITGDGSTTDFVVISNNGDLFATDTVPDIRVLLASTGAYITPNAVVLTSPSDLTVTISPAPSLGVVYNYSIYYMTAT